MLRAASEVIESKNNMFPNASESQSNERPSDSLRKDAISAADGVAAGE